MQNDNEMNERPASIANPGDRVVCINPDLPPVFVEWSSAKLEAGKIYTVTRTVLAPHYETDELIVSYQLAELMDAEVEPDTTFFVASKFDLVADH